jgi:hypothetical protein
MAVGLIRGVTLGRMLELGGLIEEAEQQSATLEAIRLEAERQLALAIALGDGAKGKPGIPEA